MIIKQRENLEQFNELNYLEQENSKEINLRLKEINAEDMKISSQVLNEDWTLVKRFKFKKENTSGYNYVYLLQCNHCGTLRLSQTIKFKGGNLKCTKCDIINIIDKVYGCYKVLNYEYTIYRNKRYCRYYKVQCVLCGKEYVKEKNLAQWQKYNRCKYCNSIEGKFGHSNLYADYKYSAKIRNISWDLQFSDFVDLVSKSCYYCGQEPILRNQNNYEIFANGIDRIDSSKGYSVDNCVPCCSRCNYMKLDLSVNDFLNHISKIYNFQFNKGSTTISQESTLQANGNGNGGYPNK